MRFLLDENFPLGLLRALRADGLAADHIITLGLRGASDKRIRERLQDAQIVFFTQDDDFLFGQCRAPSRPVRWVTTQHEIRHFVRGS